MLAGAIVGILFAPQSGEETRDLLMGRSTGLGEKAQDMAAKMKGSLQEVVEESKRAATEAATELRDKFEEAKG
jgi:gas vesicle protein